MLQQKFYIKGMVCERCIAAVKKAMEGLDVEIIEVNLGEITLAGTSATEEELIEERLKPLGFSLLQDKKQKLVKEAKALVEEVYSGSFDFPIHFRFSALAAERLATSYDVISTAFSALEQKTLEKHIIDFRIEKIKELLVYTDSTVADIAFVLNFSSAAHLTRQFKTYTGLTPSYFKEIRLNKNAQIANSSGS
ncbi:MAG TPA: helix-turn-helix domain-containing protein [Chitinophagaceae bacterium]|nr:helix-turn-helix domain-containing protein [Chitinophagaceae bacterium]